MLGLFWDWESMKENNTKQIIKANQDKAQGLNWKKKLITKEKTKLKN